MFNEKPLFRPEQRTNKLNPNLAMNPESNQHHISRGQNNTLDSASDLLPKKIVTKSPFLTFNWLKCLCRLSGLEIRLRRQPTNPKQVIIIIIDIYPGSSTHPKVVFREVMHPIKLEFGNVSELAVQHSKEKFAFCTTLQHLTIAWDVIMLHCHLHNKRPNL